MNESLTDRLFGESPQHAAACDTMACSHTHNVGDTERMLSVLGGGIIALYGLNRGNLSGLLISAIGGSLLYRGITGHCHMYGALGMSSARDEDSVTGVPAQMGFKYETSITINRPAQDLYRHWRKLENLPRIMQHLHSVTELGGGRSRWVAQGPMNVQVQWEAEVHNEDSGRLIAWRSLPGSQVDTAGSVHFDERGAGQGTELRVSLKYNPPGGQLGAGLAWLLGSSAEQEIEEDLRRFKQAMETGEVPTTAGQPSGR